MNDDFQNVGHLLEDCVVSFRSDVALLARVFYVHTHGYWRDVSVGCSAEHSRYMSVEI